MPNRVSLTDSGKDVILKLCAGNPGALSVLLQWVKFGELIDPDAGSPWIQMLVLDDLDIVGPRVWVLYKDVCGEDLRRFLGVLRAYQLGFLSKETLLTAAPGTDADRYAATALRAPAQVDALLADVEALLPAFMKAAAWEALKEADRVQAR